MNKITLTQAQFDALPIHRTPPGRDVATRWKLESGGKWWFAEYVETKWPGEAIGIGVREIKILEIEVKK